jgi:hypothetical protein
MSTRRAVSHHRFRALVSRLCRRSGERAGGCAAPATPRAACRRSDEAGSSLILALIFLVVISLVVGALASWTANNLSNTVKFQADRSAQYALSSASQVAIQNIRYTPLLAPNQTLNASPPSYCWGQAQPTQTAGTVSELTVLGNQVALWCSTVWNSSAATRVVTVSACLTSAVPTPASGSSLTSIQAAAAQCAATPGLQTVVTFEDYSASNPTVNPGVCLSPPNGSCGTGVTINSATSGLTNPTVTALSSTQGPVTGGTTLTLSGSGFMGGTSAPVVNFVATNASSNIVLQGTNVTVNSDNSLTVSTPPATTVTSYYVIVSTSSGSSAAGSQAQFTYQPVIPQVTSIATSSGGSSGSAAGGTAITISGTGFLSPDNGDNTTVTFVDTANSSVAVAAPSLTVNPYQANGTQTITATTPGISQDTTYYVVVSTVPGGTSTNGPGAPVFTFQPLTPVVASVAPTSGGSGTSVTVTGIGFVSGATTVQLVPTSGTGSTLNATNVSVSNSTTLTATIPGGGTNNATYYVLITTTTGGASCPSGNCSAGGGVPIYTY